VKPQEVIQKDPARRCTVFCHISKIPISGCSMELCIIRDIVCQCI